MGCSSCGQRYTRRNPRTRPALPTTSAPKALSSIARAVVGRRVYKLGKVTTMHTPDETNPSAGIIQPEPAAGVVIPNPDYPVDPSTGIPLSVIKEGKSPDSLGDTSLKPIAAEKTSEYNKEGANE